jgi:hypothetical protein
MGLHLQYRLITYTQILDTGAIINNATIKEPLRAPLKGRFIAIASNIRLREMFTLQYLLPL